MPEPSPSWQIESTQEIYGAGSTLPSSLDNCNVGIVSLNDTIEFVIICCQEVTVLLKNVYFVGIRNGVMCDWLVTLFTLATFFGVHD